MMSAADLKKLLRDVFELAAVTRNMDWANPQGSLDPKKMARSIPARAWKETLDVAVELSKAIPNLPRPELGADEFGGHTWLNYPCEGARVDLALKSPVLGQYEWHIIRPDGTSSKGATIEPTTRTGGIRQVVEVLRAYLVKP